MIRYFAEQGLPALVFDFHGTWPPTRPAVRRCSTPGGPAVQPVRDAAAHSGSAVNTAWEIAEIVAYVCGLGEIQRNHVYRGLSRRTGGGLGRHHGGLTGLPSVDEFAAAVEAVESGAEGKNARDRLRPLTDFGLFRRRHPESVRSATGGGMVVDVSRLGLEQVQLAAGAFLLRKVYRDMFRLGPRTMNCGSRLCSTRPIASPGTSRSPS